MERPTSTSGGSGNTGTSGSPHSCCAGLAYYTLAMQQRGAKPVRAWPGLLGANVSTWCMRSQPCTPAPHGLVATLCHCGPQC